MVLHVGSSDGQKIHLDGKTYSLNILIKTIITEGALILSSDDYILQDSNELYLTIKEDE